MTTILPEGEALKKATKWISERRTEDAAPNLAKLIEAACMKFDLSPVEADFLSRFFCEKEK